MPNPGFHAEGLSGVATARTRKELGRIVPSRMESCGLGTGSRDRRGPRVLGRRMMLCPMKVEGTYRRPRD